MCVCVVYVTDRAGPCLGWPWLQITNISQSQIAKLYQFTFLKIISWNFMINQITVDETINIGNKVIIRPPCHRIVHVYYRSYHHWRLPPHSRCLLEGKPLIPNKMKHLNHSILITNYQRNMKEQKKRSKSSCFAELQIINPIIIHTLV